MLFFHWNHLNCHGKSCYMSEWKKLLTNKSDLRNKVTLNVSRSLILVPLFKISTWERLLYCSIEKKTIIVAFFYYYVKCFILRWNLNVLPGMLNSWISCLVMKQRCAGNCEHFWYGADQRWMSLKPQSWLLCEGFIAYITQYLQQTYHGK